jgi:hypothetical protein
MPLQRDLVRTSARDFLSLALAGTLGCGGLTSGAPPVGDGGVDATATDGGSQQSGPAIDANPPDLNAPPSDFPQDTSCPGPLTASQVGALQAAASNPARLAWLYPYAGTVFAGGIAAPILQWTQTGVPEAILLHLHSKHFDFTGCYAGSSGLDLAIDEGEWATAYAQSGGQRDPLTMELRTLSAAVASGPITQTVVFAKGMLPGVVYYDTYGSKLVPGQTGAVVAIQGSKATVVLSTPSTSADGPCVSCHAAAPNGSILAAQRERFADAGPLDGKGSMTFDLHATPAPDPASPVASTLADNWGFSAVYPDGRWLLTSGEPSGSVGSPRLPAGINDNVGMIGPKAATLYDTATGSVVPLQGPLAAYPMMPMFSPDGRHLAFVVGDAAAGGHTLVVMDFDPASKTLSDRRAVFHDDTRFPGWPSFTPDGAQVVFALGNTGSFASEDPNVPGSCAASELYIVPAAGGMAHRLDAASGYVADASYLPNPADEGLDFYPSVAPAASGGYFWIFFTGRRAYGNLYDRGPGDVGSKAIWVTAIDLFPQPGVDPSHPAFYLPGQELGSGNFRPTAVFSPCRGDGAACNGGFDCCGANCATGKCTGFIGSCPAEADACNATVKCCDPDAVCINGYCARSTP